MIYNAPNEHIVNHLLFHCCSQFIYELCGADNT